MARVDAVMRRSSTNIEEYHYQVGAVFLDLEQKSLTIRNQDPISLSESECEFIHCIMRHAGQVVTS